MLGRLTELAAIDRQPDGACRRLALTDPDRRGRDLVVRWMREAGLDPVTDAIGNIVAVRPGLEPGAPILTGSHIDTVSTGGELDGAYGVIAGLEALCRMQETGGRTRRALGLAVFTNEEGVRFQPDMMGSLVFAGALHLEEALDARSSDGARLGDELVRIGYAGAAPPGVPRPHAFVELHIEQGPVLDAAGEVLGVVEGVQGISWRRVTILGVSNHAGTTPMSLRHDAGYCAGAVVSFVRALSLELGAGQVATVGSLSFEPNLINVVPRRATLTVDLRNADDAVLTRAEHRLAEFLAELAVAEGVEIVVEPLVRTRPVRFSGEIVGRIEAIAAKLGWPIRRMISGAGHDAQMLAPIAPTAMIFVPSVGGVSHNPREATDPDHLEMGANLLLQTLLDLAS